MPPVPRAVPWTGPEEYDQVYQWLYSAESRLRKLGVQHVKMWMSRGKVPHAILSTASFVEVQLRDELCYDETISQHELQLLYSMTFTRFVNGMVDPEQQGVYATSIATLAAKLQMPLWFVELRHMGTHEHLPSLVILRKGCRQALEWLNTNYWMSQKPLFSQRLNEIRDVMLEYKRTRKKLLKEQMSDESQSLATTNRILKKLNKLVSSEIMSESLIPVLLEIGILVPTGNDKRAQSLHYEIPTDRSLLWHPFLYYCCTTWSRFGDEILSAMCERLSEEDDEDEQNSYSLTIVAWVKHLLIMHYKQFAPIFGLIQVEDVLESCLRRPNVYTRSILQVLLDHDNELERSVTPFVKYIDKILTMKCTPVPISNLPRITDEELSNEIVELTNKARRLPESDPMEVTTQPLTQTNGQKETSWKLYDITDWKPCPIGCLPDGYIPSLELSVTTNENTDDMDNGYFSLH